jgi:hypothetical protein
MSDTVVYSWKNPAATKAAAQEVFSFDTGSRSPLVIAYGMGVDSTAMLVGFYLRGIRPDLILFADVGAERAATYAYLPIINAWLRSVGFPEVTVVRFRATDFKHWPHYHTLTENVLTNVSLPAIAYGGHTCSAKWKIQPQDDFLRDWAPAKECWAHGGRVLRAVGFEDSAHEHGRRERCATFSVADFEAGKYEAIYPLQDWHWDREECERQIAAVGLPVPPKSSCFFCTAMKPHEVAALSDYEKRICVILEARTHQRHMGHIAIKAQQLDDAMDGIFTSRARGRMQRSLARLKEDGTSATTKKRAKLERLLSGKLTDADRADLAKEKERLLASGKPMTEGLWRKAVKGTHANGKPNGSLAKPGSWTEFFRVNNLLPAAEIDALIAATPTKTFTRAEFEVLGVKDWADWIDKTIAAGRQIAAERAGVAA